MEEAPGLQTVTLEEAEILGAPLGKSADDNIQRKVEKLRLMGDRLQLLQSQDALLLLRHSFAIPKVMHILRSSPCFSSPQLKVFDDTLRDMLGDIINARIDDRAWAQASLPVRSGGIGIRSAVELAPSAFFGLCCWLHWTDPGDPPSKAARHPRTLHQAGPQLLEPKTRAASAPFI